MNLRVPAQIMSAIARPRDNSAILGFYPKYFIKNITLKLRSILESRMFVQKLLWMQYPNEKSKSNPSIVKLLCLFISCGGGLSTLLIIIIWKRFWNRMYVVVVVVVIKIRTHRQSSMYSLYQKHQLWNSKRSIFRARLWVLVGPRYSSYLLRLSSLYFMICKPLFFT